MLLASKWTMTNGSFRAWRSRSPTSLLVAGSGIFASSRITISDCEHTNGIFVLGDRAVMSNPAAMWVHVVLCQDLL